MDKEAMMIHIITATVTSPLLDNSLHVDVVNQGIKALSRLGGKQLFTLSCVLVQTLAYAMDVLSAPWSKIIPASRVPRQHDSPRHSRENGCDNQVGDGGSYVKTSQ